MSAPGNHDKGFNENYDFYRNNFYSPEMKEFNS